MQAGCPSPTIVGQNEKIAEDGHEEPGEENQNDAIHRACVCEVGK
jgi:hypothetical protein